MSGLRPQRSGFGFTLIELLVVISVIALLLSILLPALSRVKDSAKEVVCSTRLHQLGLAMILYCEANDGKAMQDKSGGAGEFWIYALAPYLGDKTMKETAKAKGAAQLTVAPEVLEIAYCPKANKINGNPDVMVWGDATHAWQYQGSRGSYAMNGWLYPKESQNSAYSNYYFSKFIEARPDVPVFGDANWENAWPEETNPIPKDLSKGAFSGDFGLGRFCIDRHKIAINLTFVDGHTEKVALGKLWTLKWSKVFKRVDDIRIPE